MRWIVPALLVAASTLPSSGLSADQLPAPREFIVQKPSTDGFVHIRLDPLLGDDVAALRQQIENLPYARVGEPADYELTTKKDFPQTLLAVDQHQAPRDWDKDFSGDGPYEAPRTIQLGNLVLGDYRAPLLGLLSNAAAAKLLIAIGEQGKQSEIETCIGPAGGEPAQCHVGPYREAAGSGPSPDDINYEVSSVIVRNHADSPRYVRLYLVDPAFSTHRLEFEHHVDGEPLAAGASAQTDTLDVLGAPPGIYRVVTVWSDAPFADGTLPRPNTKSPLSASFAEYRQEPSAVAGLGGGMPALPGMAAFIAEMYSTVPYTAEEKAADALKPQAKREFLSERSDDDLAHRCGGSLIAPDLVLTAAHCVATGHYAGDGMVKVLKERRIRVGSANLGIDGTTFAIAAVAVPAEYHPEVSKDHDVALLLLKRDRDTSEIRLHTVSIAAKPPATGAPLTAFGWGYMGEVAQGANPLFNLQGVLQQSPTELQFGQLAALDWGKCRGRMPVKVGSGMICAVARRGARHNVFTCRGDSGGPLVRMAGKREELIGVTSWSMGCGYKDFPSVFTDVTKYRAWIEAARRQLVPGSAIRVPLPGTTAPAETAARRLSHQ